MDIMSRNKVEPKLRFEGFNDEWEKKKLGEFCSFTQGIQLPQSEQEKNYKSGYIRYLYIRDFFKTSFKCYVKNEYPNKIIEPHQIMMVNTGNTSGKAFRGQRGVLSNNCFKVSWDESSFDADYMFLYLTSNFLQNQIKRFFNSGGQPHLGHKNVAILPFSFPSISEQHKISSFLIAVDKKLQQLTKKKELLEEYKKGVMQKIFSQELRFKDNNGNNFPDWEENNLGECLIKHAEKSTENNQYPVLTSSRRGLFFQKDYFNGQNVASKDNTGYNVVPRGYFTYRHMSDDLDFKFNINHLCDRGIVSTLYPVFTTNEKLDDLFLLTKLNHGEEFKRYAVLQKQGGSRTYMYFKKLELLKLFIPHLAEQIKITNFLSSINSKIELLSTQIEDTESFKKGLLQQMFV